MKNLKRRFTSFLARLGGPLGIADMRREIENVRQTVAGCARATRESQILLKFAYQQKKAEGGALPGLDDVEFRAYSQNGEDGILWYIFSVIGTTNKKCVEICAGDGVQCNTANLIVNHGWNGLLLDGDQKNVTRGKAFYAQHPDTFKQPPRFVHAWIDTENVNQLITAGGCGGEIDLLSLDIDGIDYWLWKAITVIRPRVVVAEVQAIWGDSRSVTVPYRSDFRAEYVNGFGIYCGASLPAFVKLARAKGYRLVGTQRHGYNAFFLRDDVGQDSFPELSTSEWARLPFVKWANETLLPLVKDKTWVEI